MDVALMKSTPVLVKYIDKLLLLIVVYENDVLLIEHLKKEKSCP